VNHGTCSYIYVYTDKVANNFKLHLYIHDCITYLLKSIINYVQFQGQLSANEKFSVHTCRRELYSSTNIFCTEKEKFTK